MPSVYEISRFSPFDITRGSTEHYLIPSSDSLTHSVFLFYFLKVGQINLRCHGHDSRIGPCNVFVSIAIIWNMLRLKI